MRKSGEAGTALPHVHGAGSFPRHSSLVPLHGGDMSSKRIQAVFAAGAILLPSLLAACEQPVPVPASSASSCRPDCVLGVDTAWSSDPANPDLSMMIPPIERGDSLLIVNAFANKALVLLGSDGKTVRTIGRAGDGPGEYRSISAIDRGADGRVHVFDRRRLTVL